MDDFKLEPAHDLGLTHRQRTLSLQREPDLLETVLHHLWWGLVKCHLRLYHRLRIEGAENIPKAPPYVLVANHASHLDALVMAAPMPRAQRDRIFPVAAGDVFFETPAIATFAMSCLNALPMWRNNCGRHALGELRKRLVEEPCVYILFPEGKRSRDGSMQPFRAGLGMMLAETGVPVVPCYLDGAYSALPPGRFLPRPHKLVLRIGEPLRLDGLPNAKQGWQEIATRTEEAVSALAPSST